MAIQRAAHAVYDTRYHIVWAPKYRKWILRGDLRDFVEQCITEIAISNDFEIEQMQIAEDHVHIFLGFPPKYSISTVVKRLKGASARAIFERYPEVKRELWGGEFWEDGYFARTVGDKVTKDMIKKYIKYHKDHERTPQQLELF
jgi:putative transposase